MSNRTDIMRIIQAFCRIDGVYDNIFKSIGSKINLMWLLYVLDDGEFHSQKQICEDWLFPKTTINTLIKECEAAGYITLQTIPGHKRELQICLTDEGKNYARRSLRTVYEAEEEALEETLKMCSDSFISDFIIFSNNIKTAFENKIKLRND